MNILITGCSGFIGTKLMSALAHEGHTVVGISRTLKRSNICNEDLSSPSFDVSLLNNLVEQIANEQVSLDCVIHTASVLADDSNNSSLIILDENYQITRNVIKICDHFSPRQLINLSSIAVYPNISGTYSENSAVSPGVNPEGLYGLSKVIAEALFEFYLQKKSMSLINLRLAQVYGSGMRDDRIYRVMANELDEFNRISVWGNGERISNFVHVENVVVKIVALLKLTNTSGVFNLGGSNMSYKELAESIINQSGNEDSKLVLVAKGSKSKFYLDTSKLDKLLNAVLS